MGLLDFVKSAGAKILGATGTAAAPPAHREQEAARHGLDVAASRGHDRSGQNRPLGQRRRDASCREDRAGGRRSGCVATVQRRSRGGR